MAIRGILFDLDGTLVDSLADLAAATNRALRELGLPEHPLPPYRNFVGDGARKLVERALPPDRRDPSTIDDALERMRAAYAEGWAESTAPYPGVVETLEKLDAGPLRLGILSNKPQPFTERIVQHFFPQIVFAPVRGAVPEIPLKPDPAAGALVADAWGCPPSDILFVGDSAPDMQFATRAGMRPIGVAWGFRGREELEREGASHILDTMDELLEMA